MKKLLAAIYAFIMTVFGLAAPGDDLLPVAPREGVPTEENIALFREVYETEMEWLASLQLDNGAIPMTPVKNGEVRMNPYFADFAALAPRLFLKPVQELVVGHHDMGVGAHGQPGGA